jgi:hypothetical protein
MDVINGSIKDTNMADLFKPATELEIEDRKCVTTKDRLEYLEEAVRKAHEELMNTRKRPAEFERKYNMYGEIVKLKADIDLLSKQYGEMVRTYTDLVRLTSVNESIIPYNLIPKDASDKEAAIGTVAITHINNKVREYVYNVISGSSRKAPNQV